MSCSRVAQIDALEHPRTAGSRRRERFPGFPYFLPVPIIIYIYLSGDVTATRRYYCSWGKLTLIWIVPTWVLFLRILYGIHHGPFVRAPGGYCTIQSVVLESLGTLGKIDGLC